MFEVPLAARRRRAARAFCRDAAQGPEPGTSRNDDTTVTGFDKIDFANLTDVGVRRSHNQDAHATLPAVDAVRWAEQGHAFLVADGMGAHAVGELASKLAVDNILHTYTKHAQDGAAAALKRAFQEANATIHGRGQANREFAGMGTTGTALVLRPEGAWVAHVGDSRAYRVRDGVIGQLSYDHSLLWEQARRQHLDPDEVEGVPSNVILRSLGPEAAVQVDVEGPYLVRVNDVFVVCSDGLSGPVQDDEIGSVAANLTPTEACRFLIDLANFRGGPDNISVIVVKVLGTSPEANALATKRQRTGSPRWGLVVLLSGLVLAVVALLLLLVVKLQALAVVVVLLAAGALLTGLGRLVFESRDERRRAESVTPSRTKPFRQRPCAVDDGMVGRLAKAVTTLQQQIREKAWPTDWRACQRHSNMAEAYARQGDLASAFAEYCRAMRPLAEATQAHRNKEEVFMPHWDVPGPRGGQKADHKAGNADTSESTEPA